MGLHFENWSGKGILCNIMQVEEDMELISLRQAANLDFVINILSSALMLELKALAKNRGRMSEYGFVLLLVNLLL